MATKREIKNAVMASIVLPDHFSNIVVIRVWPHHFRVNVYRFSDDQVYVRHKIMVYSYFVKVRNGMLTFDPILKPLSG